MGDVKGPKALAHCLNSLKIPTGVDELNEDPWPPIKAPDYSTLFIVEQLS
jgi:hypothetical protein